MSEYQCYEFVALDRPLATKQMAELRAISTRAEISPTRFWNEYEWGDLKADPAKLVERYFDAHLHFANWGTHRLMLRLPKARIDMSALKAYFTGGHAARLTNASEHVVLDFTSNTEELEYDEESPGSLAALAALRTEVMRGDLRPAYLAWLLTVQMGDTDDDITEPPVPANIAKLSTAQQAMVEFLRIDVDLIAAAASSSEATVDDGEPFRRWVASLSVREKDAWLRRAAVDTELALGSELLREFRATKTLKRSGARRSVAELRAIAETQRATREHAKTERAKKAAKAAEREDGRSTHHGSHKMPREERVLRTDQTVNEQLLTLRVVKLDVRSLITAADRDPRATELAEQQARRKQISGDLDVGEVVDQHQLAGCERAADQNIALRALERATANVARDHQSPPVAAVDDTIDAQVTGDKKLSRQNQIPRNAERAVDESKRVLCGFIVDAQSGRNERGRRSVQPRQRRRATDRDLVPEDRVRQYRLREREALGDVAVVNAGVGRPAEESTEESRGRRARRVGHRFADLTADRSPGRQGVDPGSVERTHRFKISKSVESSRIPVSGMRSDYDRTSKHISAPKGGRHVRPERGHVRRNCKSAKIRRSKAHVSVRAGFCAFSRGSRWLPSAREAPERRGTRACARRSSL